MMRPIDWRHAMLQETAERAPLQRPLASATPKPDDALVNDWHVIAFSKDVAEGQMLGVRLLGEELVVWRNNGKVHGLEGPVHPSRGAPVEGLGGRRHCRVPLSRLALRRRSEVRIHSGASRHAAAAQGARIPASGRGALRVHLGLARRPAARHSAFPGMGRLRNSESSTPVPTRSAPMYSDRWRTSSTPRISRSCMPASTA